MFAEINNLHINFEILTFDSLTVPWTYPVLLYQTKSLVYNYKGNSHLVFMTRGGEMFWKKIVRARTDHKKKKKGRTRTAEEEKERKVERLKEY